MANEHEFEVGAHIYLAGRLDARKQLHVVRRLGTVASAFGDVLEHLRRLKSLNDAPIAAVEPVLKAFGELPDADVDYIVTTCLAVVKRRQDNHWHRVQSGNGDLMYQDIEMADMLKICFEVMKANLSSFFLGLLSGQSIPAGMGQALSTGSVSPTAKTGS